ncbi:MAG TPA: RNA 3'-terminal phosphate cyclase [Vicinamibacteria bacterium]|jgi:RNA 3'-terminal phosphate cyclase (ATP)
MSGLIRIDGSNGEGGGQILRTALTLSAATGQGFEIKNIRSRRLRPGLRPQHLAAVRAAALTCGARAGGVFEGSLDLRFEPGHLDAGDFQFEIATAGAATLVAQTVLPALARCDGTSRVDVGGGTHVPFSPSFDYLARHWAPVCELLGLHVKVKLGRAGFYPPGGGRLHASVEPWRTRERMRLERRGALVAVRGVSGACRLRGDVAERQRDAALRRLWEDRRLEGAVELLAPPSASPGSFLLLEAVFETGRAAFSALGQRGLSSEILGDRVARSLLRFLEQEGAVDPHLADQVAVPLALGAGGLVTTSEVTRHLETVARILGLFGVPARVEGTLGRPGALEVGSC